ncbi:MAG: PEP-CTERM sorting domain-containing protein [Methylotetracoccus sp.]|jgi:hypothetical protein|nr:PEP-CTERM sorting domain-containing protein [Methylotetracoccus sp.]
MTIRKLAAAMATAGVMSFPMAAQALQVAGIDFAPGFIFERAELWENEDRSQPGNGDGAVQVGEYLVGIGQVTTIRDAASNLLWQNGQNGKELNILIRNYKAESASSSNIPFTNLAIDTILFSGGIVELWSQDAGTFNPAALTQAAGIASVNGGTNAALFLTLAGSPSGGFAGGNPVTLTSNGIRLATDNPFLTATNLTGEGSLDVTGGLAAPYLDTNMFGCSAASPAPCPDDADKLFTSSAQLNPAGVWASIGTGEIRDYAVPEPGTIALLGIGLLGACFARRRVGAGV